MGFVRDDVAFSGLRLRTKLILTFILVAV